MNKTLKHIFFFHNGNKSEYLKESIRQAKYYNEKIEIILLGDEENNIFNDITHANIIDYSNYAHKFVENFVYLADQSMFEYFSLLMSFKRWFVILEYMQKNNITDAYYQDSDIIMNCSLKNVKYDDEYWYYVNGGYTPVAFDVKKLSKFCEFILKYFTEDISIEHLLNMRLNYKKASFMPYTAGWAVISDMELKKLFLLEEEIPNKIISTNQKASVFSLTLYTDFYISEQGNHRYEMIKGEGRCYNKFYSKNGKVFVKDIAINKFIIVETIHFAGIVKPHIKPFMKYLELKKDEMLFYNFNSKKWEKDQEESDYLKYLALKDTIHFLKDSSNDQLKNRIINILENFFQLDLEFNNVDGKENLELLHQRIKSRAYENLEKRISNRKLIGWGSGAGLKLLQSLFDYNFIFSYLVDSNKEKIGLKKNGLDIVCINNLLKENKNDILIIVLSETYYDEIKIRLISMGFEEGNHFVSIRELGNWIYE